MDMEETELTVLRIIHCEKLFSDYSICRIEPLLKWEILKEATKVGISERRAREVLNYLERKGYFDYTKWNNDLYVLNEQGIKHLEKMAKEEEERFKKSG
jgi:predicted transcriptional regulator